MADEPKVNRPAERAAQRGTQSNPDAVVDEPKPYPVDDLRENSVQLLGVSRPTIDGALYGQTRKSFTLDEMKALVEEFLTREHS